MKPGKFSLKLLCVFIAFVLVTGVSPSAVKAAVNPVLLGESVSAKDAYSEKIAPLAFSDSVDFDALAEYLEEQLSSFSSNISLSKFKIPKTNDNVTALGNLIYCQIPTTFHVGAFRYGSNYFSSNIDFILPEYQYDADTYASMMTEIDESAANMIADIKGSSLDDVQKALLVHDRIATLNEYTLIEDTADPFYEASHNMYGAMVLGKSVCEGYAAAYTYVLDMLNIPSFMCVSLALNHAWNIVYIDGVPYHVDITWDDPSWNQTDWNVAGNVTHSYFLVSTDYMRANGHNSTDYESTPTDTRYEGYFWQTSEASFQLLGDTVYYMDTEGKLSTYEGELILSVDERWWASSSSYWGQKFSCLATDGTFLLYSTPEAIYAYSPEKNRSYKAYEPDLSKGDYFYVYGMEYENGKLILDINNSPNFINTEIERVTVEFNFTVPVITGDVDDDGALSANDYILIRMHCNLKAELSEDMAKNADLNEDGIISVADYITVMMLLKQ